MIGGNWSSQLWHPYSRAILCLASITIISSLYCINNLYTKDYIILTISKSASEDNHIRFQKITQVPNGYVVYSPKCHIPDMKLLSKEVRPLIKKKYYQKCTKNDPLTYIESFHNYSILHIDDDMRYAYAYDNEVKCCYKVITRDPTVNKLKPDDGIVETNCTYFNSTAILDDTIEFVIVTCSQIVKKKSKNIYKNVHSKVPMKKSVKQRINAANAMNRSQPLSVLIVGIDSVSRLNLHRAMPKTAQYLRSKDWIELEGYNKMGDNTYPNLQAILTGFNQEQAYNICVPSNPKILQNCPFVFNKYREAGYATVYAEDEPTSSTYNYRKNGFIEQPTDYYIRPYFLAAEKHLPIRQVSGMHYCVGPVSSGERILDYVHQFVETFKSDPYFGLFWMNSFSHNDVNDPSMMDLKIKQWFERMEETTVFNTSMVVFLSDHGVRFGRIRETVSGWLEERLPFIHIWLPQWFRNKFPQAVDNLVLNANRFTTPYDLYMTLQDVLVKSGRLEAVEPSAGCNRCHSLFEEMDFNRTCEDANINLHWCTCYGYKKTIENDPDVKKAAKVFVAEIQRILSTDENASRLCEPPVLNRIMRADKVQYSPTRTLYLLQIDVVSGSGKFEASIMHTKTGIDETFQVKGDISRINMYSTQSHCVDDGVNHLIKFCYCKKQL